MCIAILTTAHPDYPFILLNNRDVCAHIKLANAVLTFTGISAPSNSRGNMVAITRLSGSRGV